MELDDKLDVEREGDGRDDTQSFCLMAGAPPSWAGECRPCRAGAAGGRLRARWAQEQTLGMEVKVDTQS